MTLLFVETRCHVVQLSLKQLCNQGQLKLLILLPLCPMCWLRSIFIQLFSSGFLLAGLKWKKLKVMYKGFVWETLNHKKQDLAKGH